MEEILKSKSNLVSEYLQTWLNNSRSSEVASKLKDSVSYSLMNGGKRFRPTLSLLVADLLQIPSRAVLPWGAAIEMIHTYSLIHDDLPCMDNDDMRRGQPTNHKVFGDDIALLAGDALLTEAFGHVAQGYLVNSQILGSLILILNEAAGWSGMVNGQVLDMLVQKNFEKTQVNPDKKMIDQIHQQKTGALIRASVEGVACIAQVSESQRQLLRTFGEKLGWAFQLADDILDYDPNEVESCSYFAVMSKAEVVQLLEQTSQEAIDILKTFGVHAQNLIKLVDYNKSRTY